MATNTNPEENPPLPEPWDEVQFPLTAKQDEGPPIGVPAYTSWMDALADSGEAWFAYTAILGLSGAKMATFAKPDMLTIALVIIFLLFGLLLWILMTLSIAQWTWELFVGPYFRSRRQLHGRYGQHYSVHIRILLVVTGSAVIAGVAALVWHYPTLTAIACIVASVSSVFSSKTRAASLLILLPGAFLIWAFHGLRLPQREAWTSLLNRFSGTTTHRELVIHHLSDLHLLDLDQNKSAEGESIDPRTNLNSLLADFRDIAEDASNHIIVVTGDITDTGGSHAWKDFFSWMSKIDRARERVVFIPGNHDLNIVSSKEFQETRQRSGNLRSIRYMPAESPQRHWQGTNVLRCLIAMSKHYGDTAKCLNADGSIVGLQTLLTSHSVPIHQYFRTKLTLRVHTYDPDHPDAERDRNGSVPSQYGDFGVWTPEVRDVTDASTIQSLRAPLELWDRAWPMLVCLSGPRCFIILLNSTRLSWSVVDNAFGEVGAMQLDRALKLHEIIAKESWPTFVLLHHSPPPEPASSHSQFLAPFLCLEDVELIIEKFQPIQPIFLSGHTHVRDGVGRWRSAPSLGYARDISDSLAKYRICIDSAGRVSKIEDFRSSHQAL